MKDTAAIRKAVRKAIPVPFGVMWTNKYKDTRTVKFYSYSGGMSANDLCKVFNAVAKLNVGATIKVRENTNFYGASSCIITVPQTY